MSTVAVSLRKPGTDLTQAAFRPSLSALLEKVPRGTLQGHTFFSLPANEPPWFDTGLDLRAGEHITVLAVGSAILSSELDLVIYPDMQLWYRVGEAGHVFRGTRQTHSFTTSDPGRLYIGNYLPGEWATRTGALSVGTDAYQQMKGGFEVAILRWAVEPLEGLKRILSAGDVGTLLASEIDRLQNATKPPPGWDYLWFLGQSEIYGAGPPSPALTRPASLDHVLHASGCRDPAQGCRGPSRARHAPVLVLEDGDASLSRAGKHARESRLPQHRRRVR